MKTKFSTVASVVAAVLIFASDLSARDGDKDGGKPSEKSRSEKTRSGADVKRSDSDRSGTKQRSAGGIERQPKARVNEPNRDSGRKPSDRDDHRLKSGSTRQDNNATNKFNDDAQRKPGDNNRRNNGEDAREERDERNQRDNRDVRHDDGDRAEHRHDKDWKSWEKDGWQKDNWNTKYNAQHRQRQHGYWQGGQWYPPLVFVQRRPVVYLQPRQQVILGQKWLGVTYEAYEGGGAYVTGIYEGSPAQQMGLEVGDVIVTLDGMDATDLPRAIQASDGDITLQVLRGRTGELAEAQVNIVR